MRFRRRTGPGAAANIRPEEDRQAGGGSQRGDRSGHRRGLCGSGSHGTRPVPGVAGTIREQPQGLPSETAGEGAGAQIRSALAPWRRRLRRRHVLAHGLAGLVLAAGLALPALVTDRWLVDPVGRTTALAVAALTLAAAAVRAWITAPGWTEAARAADAATNLGEQALTALHPDPLVPAAMTLLQRRRALDALRQADPRHLPVAPRRWRRWAAVALLALAADAALWLAPHPLAPARAQRAQWRAELARLERQVKALEESLPATVNPRGEEPGTPAPAGAGTRPPEDRPQASGEEDADGAPSPSGASPGRPEPQGPDPGGPPGRQPGGSREQAAAGGSRGSRPAGTSSGSTGEGSAASPVSALSGALDTLARQLQEARASLDPAALARAAATAQRAADLARAAAAATPETRLPATPGPGGTPTPGAAGTAGVPGGAAQETAAALQALASQLSTLAGGLEVLARHVALAGLARGLGSPGAVPFLPGQGSGPGGAGSPAGGGSGLASGSPPVFEPGTPPGTAPGSSPGSGAGSGGGSGRAPGSGPGGGPGGGSGAGAGGGSGNTGAAAGGSPGGGGAAQGAGGAGWGRGTTGSPLAGGLASTLPGGTVQRLPGAQVPGSLTLPGWADEPITIQPGQTLPAGQLQRQWASQAALDLGRSSIQGLSPELQWLVQAYFGGTGTDSLPGP
ncbi:hypothetical protein [Thermaerobacter subterraneus]|uniref:Uncharacterized protein n=1 Tax=Thermaerobacter subterraneus DSM 13965 TaxID=867903 RepID=K6P2F8_9FIRM|nr:hypothetical protein [Thermaerobacter subterraneus]EKP95255.1 hypothetical protein ThesuDRAFT_00998 [Thermaerobacter subterraneus DSM 13965]